MVRRWRRLLTLGRFLLEHEDQLLNEIVRVQLDGKPVTWLHGVALQGLFALMVRTRP